MRVGLEHPSVGNNKDNGDEATVAAPSTAGNDEDSMEFESKEDAFTYYKNYASSVGFSAIIKASRRSRISGKFIDAKFVCTRYGNKRGLCDEISSSISVKKKRGRINRSWSKTDCKACMHVKRRQDGRWIISSFIREHNHGLSDKDICNAVQFRGEKMQKTECHKSISSRTTGLRLGFREGDAQVMLEHLTRMQDANPYFFYAVDLNTEQQLRNVFWVDAKGRIDYQNFGDVVFLDTRNDFKLPFVPFIGMNNHLQLVLHGNALVADDTKLTYVWLIRAWIRSMHGHVPKVILTDQEPALKEAIAEVLPESRHCYRMWCILSNIHEKLGYVIRQHEDFTDKLYKCVLKSQTEAQFAKRWWKLVDRFDLRADKWIQSLYNDRVRWVPVHMKDIFLAGLSSKQSLDSVALLLDKCLPRKTSLKEFLSQYNIMLQHKYEDEAKAEFDTWRRQPGLKSPSPYGKQMATIYTRAVFKKFQVEVLGVVACHPKMEGKDGETTVFKVQDFDERQVYEVTWNEMTFDTSCACRLFEFNGFLCRHAMIVLQISGVNKIPAKYVLKRWTKEAKNREVVKGVGSFESRNQGYSDLCQCACKLGDQASSLCQETYSFAFTAVEEAIRKCESINNNNNSNDIGLLEFQSVNQGGFFSSDSC